MDKKYLKDWATALVLSDQQRNSLFAGVDNMVHCAWKLPPELSEKADVRTVINMRPHDSLIAATKALSTVMPNWKVLPLNSSEVEYGRAEEISNALSWHFNLMNSRPPANLLWDLVHSSLRYDTVAAWVDYLPQWINSKSKRLSRAQRYGVFNAQVYHPAYVHSEVSAHGLEAVLLATNNKAFDVIRKFKGNDKASIGDIEKKFEETNDPNARFVLYDFVYWDNSETLRRIIWGDFVSGSSVENVEMKYVILDSQLPYDFIPWVLRTGGSKLELDNEFKVHPLLSALYFSGLWETQNIVESLLASESIRYARMPRIVTITYSGDGVLIDFEDGAQINLKVGEDVRNMQPPQIDPMLLNIVNKGETDIAMATLARALQSLEFVGNTPYATVNAILQTAISSLTPYRKLAEFSVADLGMMMLEWINFTGDDLISFRSTGKIGQQVTIGKKDFDLENLFIGVELQASTPTDEMQRVNMARVKYQDLQIPLSNIHEELGYENSSTLVQRWMQEQMVNTIFQDYLSRIQAKTQIEIQGALNQQQVDIQTQQQEAQQQQVAPTNPFEAVMGQEAGFNPAEGGSSPYEGAPQATREAITGETYTGEETVV